MSNCTKERFLRDVADHKLEVVKDEGVHRHIVMSMGGSTYRYELTTWPYFICISGDMGCFVFSRVKDMFTFFRNDDLAINEGYWHEKLEAVPLHGGATGYSSDSFTKAVKVYFEDCAPPEWDKEKRGEA